MSYGRYFDECIDCSDQQVTLLFVLESCLFDSWFIKFKVCYSSFEPTLVIVVLMMILQSFPDEVLQASLNVSVIRVSSALELHFFLSSSGQYLVRTGISVT